MGFHSIETDSINSFGRSPLDDNAVIKVNGFWDVDRYIDRLYAQKNEVPSKDQTCVPTYDRTRTAIVFAAL